jgi:hypothetical protein
MDRQEAIPRHCPNCACSDGVVHAASVTGHGQKPRRSAGKGETLLDIRIPARTLWSGLWACAAGCFVLALVAWLINSSTGWLGAAGVFAVFGATFASLGVWQTRLNRDRMRGAEPQVLKFHSHALYCRTCACVYFDIPKPPAGISPGKALSVREYRRRLWYACGFTKPL